MEGGGRVPQARREVTAQCHDGATAAREGKFPVAMQMLTSCLALPQATIADKAAALKARARAQSGMLQPQKALRDFESALELQPATTYWEWMNLAFYLRLAGKPYESLAAIDVAERYQDAKTRARTQQEKRLVLQQLGRSAVD